MDDETLAALEAAESALTIFEDARSARLIRARIEQERSGGALAKVVALQAEVDKLLAMLERAQQQAMRAIEQRDAAHRAGQAHIAARLRERADAATGSAQAVLYEIVRMIETGEL